MAEKQTIRITRLHHTDLHVASMNLGKDGEAIWNRLNETYDFVIDEKPLEGYSYTDLSVNFLYPQGAEKEMLARGQTRSIVHMDDLPFQNVDPT